mmetsp:Transcript_117500/g.215255  ORF Transcript_117500/g.215255 Transcript_117500/m.215255 type:complete len:82 (+) Transcript_117500:158-403(+)
MLTTGMQGPTVLRKPSSAWFEVVSLGSFTARRGARPAGLKPSAGLNARKSIVTVIDTEGAIPMTHELIAGVACIHPSHVAH